MENENAVAKETIENLKEIRAGVAIIAWFLGILIILGGVALYHFW